MALGGGLIGRPNGRDRFLLGTAQPLFEQF